MEECKMKNRLPISGNMVCNWTVQIIFKTLESQNLYPLPFPFFLSRLFAAFTVKHSM